MNVWRVMQGWLAVILLLAGLGGPSIAAAQATPDQVIFGPQQYLRTSGAPNQYTSTITVPASVGPPFLLHIVNGQNRISSAWVDVNTVQVAGPSDFGQNVAIVDRTITLNPGTNQLKVKVASTPGAYLTITVYGTKILPTPTTLTPNPLNLTAGSSGTLTATIAPAPTTAGTLTVSSTNTGIATVPSSVAFAVNQTSLAIPVTAVGVGNAQVTVSLNGGDVSATVDVSAAPPTLASLQPASETITQGGTGNLTVTISATQSTNTTIALTSSATGIASVPATVTVPAGHTTAPIAVSANTPGTAVITASLNNTSAGSTVTVTPNLPTIVSLLPPTTSINLGATGTLTVTISAMQSSATTIQVTTAPSGIVTVPGTVLVPAGQLTTTVPVTAAALGTAMVHVSLNSSMAESAVQVTPPPPAIVSLLPSPLPLVVGASGTLTVTLNAGQLANTEVGITASPSGIVQVPAIVTVPAGQTQATFTVSGLAVGSATITVSLNGTMRSAIVQVQPPPPQVVSLLPNPLPLQQGATGSLTLTINAAQLADTVVTLTNTAPTLVQIPASITVPANQLSATISVTALLAGNAPITAAINGSSVNALVQVTPPPPAVASLTTVSPDPPGTSLTRPKGTPGTLRVTLSRAPTDTTLVTLTSSATTVAQVPASVTVAAGALTADFPVNTVGEGTATITASLNGGSATATVTVTPAELVLLTLSPQNPTLFVGESPVMTATGTLTDGTTQNLTTDSRLVWTSTNQTVATISSSGLLNALAIGTSTIRATFTPTVGTPTIVDTSLTVLTPPALTLTATPTTVQVGQALSVTVTSARVADIGGLPVTIMSSGTGAVSHATTITILENQTSASFVVSGVTAGSVTLTATAPIRTPGVLNVFVNPVTAPLLLGMNPLSGPAGTVVTLTGVNFFPQSADTVVRLNGLAVTLTAVTPTQLTFTVPTGATSGPITITTPLGTTTSPQAFVINRLPVLDSIGNKTVALGSTLTFTTTAVDPDVQTLTFAVTPMPLMAHASFNAQTGLFVFTPDVTQVGTFPLTISVNDGLANVSESITISVTGAPPGGATGLSGRVVDGSGLPIANMVVTVKATGQAGTTNAQGQFTINGVTASGRQVLLANGAPLGYAILAAPVDLIANVMNNLASELRIPALDMASAVTVNPNATTVLGNPAFPAVSVTIPPHTAKNPDGTDFTGQLTISPVPEYGRPESRPVELKPGFSITIQPAGITMATPVPLTLPNIDNLAPGNELDLWSLYPDTGTFLVVGRMRVSTDGSKLEMIPGTGGVRKTAWHFALAPNLTSTPPENPTLDECPECQGIGSGGRLSDGALTHEVTIPGIRTLGVSRDVTLHYRSTSADVQPILPVHAFLSVRAAVPQTFSASLKLGGSELVSGLYWNSSGLPENNDSTSRLGVQFNGAALPTGRYNLELTLSSNYPQSSIGGISRQPLLVRNEQQSPYGAGWTLAGVDRLLVQVNGDLVLAQGTGGTEMLVPVATPLVIASPSLTRSRVVNGANASFVAGNIHAQPRADLQNVTNFSPTGTIKRNVTFRPGLDVVTLEALAGVDIFIINLLATELTLSEVHALEQFVAEGGAVLEMGNLSANRLPILGTLPGPFVSDTTADLTLEGLNSVLANGPFGTVVSPVNTGANSFYATGGFATSMARNDQGQNILLSPPGSLFTKQGRAVLVGDEEIFASAFPGGGGATLYTLQNNVQLFLNTIAYLADTPGYKTNAPIVTTSFQGPPGDFSTIVKNADGTYTRTMKDGKVDQFNAQGYHTTTRDRNGNTTIYTYNGSNQLTTMTDPVGQVTTFTYSGNWLQSVTDAAGRTTTLAHDGAGNLTGLTHADGAQETLNYDVNHRLIERRDARGARTQYQYDYAKRFMKSIKPTGETLSIVPSQRLAVPDVGSGQGTAGNPAALSTNLANPASYTDARNHTTTFELDSLRRVVKQTNALNRVTLIQRDPQGHPLVITRPNGAITTMTYDVRGNLLTSTEQAIAATTTFTYEPTFNQVTSIKDPKNNLTAITYDAKGNPLTITDADNKVTTFTYDSRGLLLTSKDALNQTTTFTYNALGRLLTTTDPLNRTTTLTYDTAGNVATSKDALDRLTQFQYDSKNRLKKVIDPLLGETIYTYDGNGNLLTVKDAKNQTTTFAYDSRNRLISTTDPLGKIETYEYDGNDNLTKRHTPKGDDLLFAYDPVNQLLSKTLPGSQLTSYQYDLAGNLTNVTDPDSVLAMTYDPANRLTTVKTDGSPNQPAVTVGSAYDPNGNRSALLSPGTISRYGYDVLNRVVSLTGPTSQQCLAPSPVGLVSWWPAEGTTQDLQDGNPGTLQNGATFAPGQLGQAFSFDGVNDVVTIPDSANQKPPLLTVAGWVKLTQAPAPGTEFFLLSKYGGNFDGWIVRLGSTLIPTFSIHRQPAVATHTSAAVAIPLNTWVHLAATYDGTQAALYINGVVQGSGVLSGGYTPTAVPMTIGAASWFSGGFMPGLIDEVTLSNRALSASEIQAMSCTETQGTTTFAYDAVSRRTSLTLANGTQTTYQYDPASQVTNILHQLTATSAQINKADYVYNNIGNRTSLTDKRGSQTFGYDPLDRLTSASHPLLATPQAFAYDPVGNRTTGGSVVNAGNQLTADTNFAYQYDDNGNLIRKALLATGNFTVYTYDAENRLTKVEDFAAGANTPATTSTYRYDGLGRRIEKVANGQVRRYIYDRADILLEYDGNNALQARYTHGPRIDEPIAITKGSSTFFYHQDGLGTVTELTDSSGTIAKSYAYDAYGNIVDQTGSLDQPYTFTGREFDSETGLYYYRARYYDAASGRFLQHDPLRFFGGDLNLYGYVLNSPNNLVDPWGLWWTSGHRSLTTNAASSRCFSSTDVDLMVDANLHIDRLSNQLNNPDHYMPGTEEEAAGRVRMWMDLAVSLELKGDHQGAMGALGTGSHPVQDRLAHSAQNAGWQKHGKIWDSPDDPQKHPGEFNQALMDTQSYIDEFLLRTGRQGCVCSQGGSGN